MTSSAAEISPLAVDAADAARLLGISPAHLFSLKAQGKFGPAPMRLGRAVRYRVDELKAWLGAGCPSRSKWLALSAGK